MLVVALCNVSAFVFLFIICLTLAFPYKPAPAVGQDFDQESLPPDAPGAADVVVLSEEQVLALRVRGNLMAPQTLYELLNPPMPKAEPKRLVYCNIFLCPLFPLQCL
jgi:hypothetical protein